MDPEIKEFLEEMAGLVPYGDRKIKGGVQRQKEALRLLKKELEKEKSGE